MLAKYRPFRNPSHIGRPAYDSYGASSYVSNDLMDQLYQSQRVPSTATTSGLGPYPKVEPGVKFRPLAFYDQIELIQKTGKIPGNGTRVAGTQFYIRIPNTAMKKFVQGQVRQNLISPIVRLFSSGMIFR